MSTRCFIGIEMEKNAIVGIYNHFDGYPSGVGKLVKELFKYEDEVWKLISLGNRTELRENISEGIYGGHDETPRFEKSVKEIFEHQSDFEYVYLFRRVDYDKPGMWLYATYDNHKLRELTDEVIATD